MSLREQISSKIVSLLGRIQDPRVVLATREPFEPEKLAITQFPGILIQLTREDRETVTMGASAAGRRAGTMTYEIRGFVRGTDLDMKRTELITAIENALDADRYLGLGTSGVMDSQLIRVDIVPRLAPLAEFVIEFQVKYNYLRGSV
jgi:hypothetical protein